MAQHGGKTAGTLEPRRNERMAAKRQAGLAHIATSKRRQNKLRAPIGMPSTPFTLLGDTFDQDFSEIVFHGDSRPPRNP